MLYCFITEKSDASIKYTAIINIPVEGYRFSIGIPVSTGIGTNDNGSNNTPINLVLPTMYYIDIRDYMIYAYQFTINIESGTITSVSRTYSDIIIYYILKENK